MNVSIHAPWEGCDRSAIHSFSEEGSFNSRTLGRVRPEIRDAYEHSGIVSIHAPWEGCD